MKYLKLYESDEYYTEVTSYWKTVAPVINHYILNENEVNSIKSIIKSTNGQWTLSNTQKTLNFKLDETAIKSEIIIDFTKIEDEYYIISLFERNPDRLIGLLPWEQGLRYHYYKCDQLDGLRRCIEEKVNWKINQIESLKNLKESQFWSEVLDGQYDFNKNCQKFTNSEWIEINNIFSLDYISNTYQSPIYKVFDIKINDNRNEIKFLYYSQSRYKGNDTKFVIYKLPDEWFFIVDQNRYKFYSCDQFDGLVDCLKKNFYV